MKTSLKTILATATVLSSAWAVPALGQDAEEDAPVAGNEIIVTATRIEQRLQDVPISITVLDESKITNNNIQSAKDIATYTPGLTTNNRYGSDNTTWTIRGFTQEQRTTSTVGSGRKRPWMRWAMAFESCTTLYIEAPCTHCSPFPPESSGSQRS